MKQTDNERRYPECLIGKDFVKDDMLRKLGISSESRLEYKFGSYKLPESVQESDFEGIDLRKTDNFEFDEFGRPTGGAGLVTKITIKEGGKKGSSPFLRTGFDAGHILGKQLFQGSSLNTSKKNKKNIYRQTKWSNKGNHPKKKDCNVASWGYNQTYFENLIRNRICEENNFIEVKYRADLIYHSDELIPRGIHIRSLCNIPDMCEKLNLNFFIPNVEINGIIDYTYTTKLKLIFDE